MNAKQLIESEYQPTELEMEYMAHCYARDIECDFYGPGLYSIVSDDGSTIKYYRVINRNEWPGGINNQLRHREDGPASVIRHSNGDTIEEWFFNGLLHRDGGPATTLTNSSGVLTRWYTHGVRNRLDGPAVVNDGYSSIDAVEEWFVNGIAIKKRYRDGEWWFRS